MREQLQTAFDSTDSTWKDDGRTRGHEDIVVRLRESGGWLRAPDPVTTCMKIIKSTEVFAEVMAKLTPDPFLVPDVFVWMPSVLWPEYDFDIKCPSCNMRLMTENQFGFVSDHPGRRAVGGKRDAWIMGKRVNYID